MKILLQLIQFPPDVNSTGLLLARLGEEFVRRGHEVSVVTGFPHYEHFRVWDEYRGKLAERGEYKGMRVLRLAVLTPGRKQRMVNRLVSYLSFNALATVANWLEPNRPDVILTPNGSFFTGVSAYLSGRPVGIPFVYNVQDLYPETFVRAGRLTNGSAIRGLERIERAMYRGAARIAVIAPSFRDHLLEKGVPADKVVVIPNFVDTDFIRPLPKDNTFSRAHGLHDRFVVSHAGNLGYVYDLETLLQAANLLRDEPDILFLIVGDGVAKPELGRRAQDLALPNVRFLPFQPAEQLPLLRAACDVHVALYRKGQARYSLPSKIYEIMASGRPLLASAEPASDVWSVVQATGCGVCVEPERPEALEGAIRRLHRDRKAIHAMADAGRKAAVRDYSITAVADEYEELLRNVINGSQPDRAAV